MKKKKAQTVADWGVGRKKTNWKGSEQFLKLDKSTNYDVGTSWLLISRNEELQHKGYKYTLHENMQSDNEPSLVDLKSKHSKRNV